MGDGAKVTDATQVDDGVIGVTAGGVGCGPQETFESIVNTARQVTTSRAGIAVEVMLRHSGTNLQSLLKSWPNEFMVPLGVTQ